MDSSAVSQTRIPHISRLFQDFLCDYQRVSGFYPFPPFAANSLAQSANAIRYPDEMRSAVAAVLREHNERFGASPETLRNLERFTQPGCCAVVTGQQVGLFTGPAFTLYKALTAIKLARSLTRQGVEAVPIFWLASEDHDFEEVNHCFVQDREGKPVRLQYSEPPQTHNASVGTIALKDSIVPLIDSLRTMLPDSPDAKDIQAAVESSYVSGVPFGEAFGKLLSRLFEGHGVLLLESLDPRLHRLGGSVLRTAMECAPDIATELGERNRQLIEAGYHAQVRVTPNSTLLFLFEDGQRMALRTEGGKFLSGPGRSYDPAKLISMLEADPALFSPNALLRPVMQDTLLPTVAYVGGPSEIAYLAQSEPIYRGMLGRMPVIFPRASFTVLDSVSSRLLGKYGLSLPEVLAGRQPLREKMAAKFLPEGLMATFKGTGERLREDFSAIQKSLATLDPTLVDAASNSLQKMQFQLASLERRASAAVEHRNDQVERDASRLENNLFPEKTLQERFYSGISLLAHFGMPLLDALYERISLDSGDHQIIAP